MLKTPAGGLMRSLTLSLFLLLLVAHPTAAQQQRLRVLDYSGDLQALLSQLPSGTGITIGFEPDPLRPRSAVTVRIDDANMEQIMEAIVKASPNYVLQKNGETFNVVPKNRQSPLLDVRIPSLNLQGVQSDEAIAQLLATDVIKNAMAEMSIRFAPVVQSSSFGGKAFSLNLTDVTFRDALNQIATSSDLRFWMFEQKGTEYFSIRLVSTK